MASLSDRPELGTRRRECEELLLHLKGLVYVRAILEQRGAHEADLVAHDAEIARVRARLARVAVPPDGW